MLASMAEDLEGEISLQTLWKETKANKEDISKQIDRMTNDIQAKLTRIETSMSTLSEQMAEVETRVSTTEDDIRDTRSTVSRLEKDVSYLKDKVQDLENRSRRSNIRIVNLPEKSEGGNMVSFLEHVIPEILGAENFPSPLIIERAHRTGNISSNRANPGIIVAKLLNFREKQKILQLAREHKVYFNNRRIHFFPDFSAELQNARKAYMDVKRMLRDREIEYSFAYPSKLRILHRGKAKFFSTPSEVKNYIDSLTKDTEDSTPE
ncbi:LINE-1 type transposase domain-containing 1 [Labeo rohita]|uniref:LINE-1 type transposase domain-containing 1 n=1 Tax=Labeo rohita TaxID=84645 RepID=A0A498NMQ1_LABRO|nr:LINE-1 type transposase domain-containing 1 [Labeo rohita]RXN32807.1 LINE-1 type transposase domain-containing 1 [Labeo rohita]